MAAGGHQLRAHRLAQLAAMHLMARLNQIQRRTHAHGAEADDRYAHAVNSWKESKARALPWTRWGLRPQTPIRLSAFG